MSGGLAWHFARPPVQGLDFEVAWLGKPVQRAGAGLDGCAREALALVLGVPAEDVRVRDRPE